MRHLSEVIGTMIAPAMSLLPRNMDSKQARIQLLATGLQESRFEYRYQVLNGTTAKGPARGFWQNEKGDAHSRAGVSGAMLHPASGPFVRHLCDDRHVLFESKAIWLATEHDDVLAAGIARLLYWTDARPLPVIGDAAGAWAYYLRVWRPGKPHPETWNAFYEQAVREVVGD